MAVLLLGIGAFAGCMTGTEPPDGNGPTLAAQEALAGPDPSNLLDSCNTSLPTQTLQEYAKDCDAAALNVTVPDFHCDDGSPVLEGNESGNFPTGHCDRPNVLNAQCDPGSMFQMLPSSNPNILMAAHCRKKGLGAGQYGDIAVIQYNKLSGATCFYQSKLQTLPEYVRAPSLGTAAFPWETPAFVAGTIKCVNCHDNGPFVRSPYLTHLIDDPVAVAKGNVLPGSHDDFWNRTLPYRFVGNDFQSWKVFQISVDPSQSTCASQCHRMAISAAGGLLNPLGTGSTLSLTATSQTGQPFKNLSAPMWMFRNQATWLQATEDQATVVKSCADALKGSGSVPPGCGWTEYGQGTTCSGATVSGVINGATQGDPPGTHTDITVPSSLCQPGSCRPGFVYWTAIHGPFWQTSSGATVPGSAAYRGSFLRWEVGSDGIFKAHLYADSTGVGLLPAPGGRFEGTGYDEFKANPPNVASCSDPFVFLADLDGSHTSTSQLVGPPNQFIEVLTGMVGNIAQANVPFPGGRFDLVQVSSGTNTNLVQRHAILTGGTIQNGPLRVESFAGTCSGWTPSYAARNVLSTNDSLLVAFPASLSARCFISGLTGAWSSTRSGGTVQPFAEIYKAANGDLRIHVGPNDVGAPADRVGALASCIKL